jgi:DNA-binding transcriptional ArsR family regulator
LAHLGPLLRSDLLEQILRLVLVDGGEWTAELLAAETGSPYPTVTKEVRRLERSGILTVRAVGRTKLLSAMPGDASVKALTRALALAPLPEGGDDMAKKKDKKKDDKKKKKK